MEIIQKIKKKYPRTNKHKKEIVIFDKEGWADNSKFKPDNFDLVQLENEIGKRFFAWWNGWCWEGKKVIIGNIVRWKKYKHNIYTQCDSKHNSE